MLNNETYPHPTNWEYEAMRTGSHLPPLMPRPQSSATSSRPPMTLSYRPRETIIFDPVTSCYVATDPVAVSPQVGYFSATPLRPQQAFRAFNDVAVSKYTPLGRRQGSDGKKTSTAQVSIPKYKPTDWIFEDDEDEIFADKPGHAAYYKSLKFQDKVTAGKVYVPGGFRPSSFVSKRRAMEIRKTESEPLVMIFGLHNMRRARMGRKADLRLQKHNKRAKWLRKMEGAESMFGWD